MIQQRFFFFQSLLQVAIVNRSCMGRGVHSLMLSILHFFCRPLPSNTKSNTKSLPSEWILSSALLLSICPISFNRTLQPDNYDPHMLPATLVIPRVNTNAFDWRPFFVLYPDPSIWKFLSNAPSLWFFFLFQNCSQSSSFEMSKLPVSVTIVFPLVVRRVCVCVCVCARARAFLPLAFVIDIKFDLPISRVTLMNYSWRNQVLAGTLSASLTPILSVKDIIITCSTLDENGGGGGGHGRILFKCQVLFRLI